LIWIEGMEEREGSRLPVARSVSRSVGRVKMWLTVSSWKRLVFGLSGV